MGRPSLFDYIIVGGGSAGSALANRLSADATTRVLVLEAGRSDYAWDPFIHMPGALTFPIGSRFYDWQYESEPEPFLNDRRIYHARGKVLGGSSSINGMIFQRGNPLDYERWAADPGMADWDYAHCLPYFKRMENCLAAEGTQDEAFRGSSGPLVLERGPADNPLFRAFFVAVQQAGYPLTSDVNGYRQEGFAAFDRNIHRGRRLSAARAYLHPVMDRPNLRVETRVQATRILFDGTRATGVEFAPLGATGSPGSRRQAHGGEVIVCAGAFGSPQLLQLSGVGNATELSALGIPVVADLPGVRREHAGPPGGVHPVRVQAAGVGGTRAQVAQPAPGSRRVVAAPFRPGRDEPLRGRRVRQVQRLGGVPEPDVPLPADRGPVRRVRPGRRARLPGAHRADVLRLARHGQDRVRGPVRQAGAAVQLPVHADRPAGVDRGDPDRQEHPEPVGVRRVQRRGAVARVVGGDRRGDPRVVARDAETALHPSCTCAMELGRWR